MTNVLVLLPMRKWSAGVKRHVILKIGLAESSYEAASFVIPKSDESCWNGRAAAVALTIVFDGSHDLGLNGWIRH